MSRAAREYITTHGTGTPLELQRTAWAITDALAPITQGKRVGALALGLATVEDLENERLDVERVMSIAGRLPVILVNVTYQTDELTPADLAAWEAQFELQLVSETEADR